MRESVFKTQISPDSESDALIKNLHCGASDQDGGVGRHTVAPHTMKEGQQQFKNKKQPELTENQTVWKSNNQGDKEETFTQTGRRGRDGQPGRRGLTARRRLADPARWRIVEWGRPGCS